MTSKNSFLTGSIFSIAPNYRDPIKQCTVAELWTKYSSSEPVNLRQVTPVTWKTKLGNTRQVMWCTKDYSTPAEQRATKLVGVLNITSDSFSGDGLAKNSNEPSAVTSAAVTLARSHVLGGADLLEVGGESTRPGADVVPASLELTRVTHVIHALRSDESFDSVPVIVDTIKVMSGIALVRLTDRSEFSGTCRTRIRCQRAQRCERQPRRRHVAAGT